ADQRLIKKTYSDGSTPTAQFQYDGIALSGCTTSPPTLTDSNPKGFRTSMCDGSGATSWNHDVMSRIQQEQRSIGTLTNSVGYTYNLDGSLATLSYPGSGPVLTYTPSAAGRVVSAVDNLSHNYVTSATYAPQGAVSSYNLGASILGRITYNVRLQLLQMYFGTNSPSGTLQSTMCPSTAGIIIDRIYHFHSGAGDN